MYDFITHTWNPIKGECPHGCTYCYMRRWGAQKPLRLDEREMRTDLGSGYYIFVGSSTDMWADAVPDTWLNRVLDKCLAANGNRYLFQTKAPIRIKNLVETTRRMIPDDLDNFVFCTTLETNRSEPLITPNVVIPERRYLATFLVHALGLHTMVTVEPIMDFDLEPFMDMIVRCHPAQVNIGADSGQGGLPEPSAEKVRELIAALESEGIKVVQKRNLKRILGR